MFVDATTRMAREVQAGSMVPLEQSNRGGYALLVTVRARNIETCNVELIARLKDPDSGTEVGSGARTVTLYHSADGWAHPSSTSNAALITVCPNYTQRNVHGESYDLEITVTDRARRASTAVTRVVPNCMQPFDVQQTDCLCTCEPNFYLEKCPNYVADAMLPGPL